MSNTKDDKRALAKAITHYIYRNTPAVEDSHSDGVIMDEKFYRKVYKSVYNKMALVEKYNKYYCKIENSEKLRQFLETSSLEKPLEFLSYGENLSYNFIYGRQWADAEVVDELPQKSLTSYILNGKFKLYCNQNRELDDNAMFEINKDIHNRIYTLLMKGYLD